jgi:lysophospholipase L1-like esterase
MGDSLGVGVGPLLEKEFRALGISAFKNISVGGKNIAQFSDNKHAEGRSFEKAMAEFKPTIVFISLGTNDEAIRRIKGGDPRWFTPASYAKNLVGPNFSVAKQRRKAIARLAGKLSGVKSIFIGPPASDPTLWPMDREFRNLLESTWRGSYFNTEAAAPQKCGDRIHLTGSGYKSWASDIARWVRGG